jgi:arsenate reductase (glutaredoxin)
MNIQIFGTLKCNETRKAERYFKERKITIQFRDLNVKGISKGELDNIKSVIPVEDLIDKEGKEYRKQNLQYIKHDIESKLLENALLFKTPIVRNGRNVTIGYTPDVWKSWT